MFKQFMIVSLLVSSIVFASDLKEFDIEQELKEFNFSASYQIYHNPDSAQQKKITKEDRVYRCYDLAQVWDKSVRDLDKNSSTKTKGDLWIPRINVHLTPEDVQGDAAHLRACHEFLKQKHAGAYDYTTFEMDATKSLILPVDASHYLVMNRFNEPNHYAFHPISIKLELRRNVFKHFLSKYLGFKIYVPKDSITK